MVLTDTHTHLYYESNAAERGQLIQRCTDKGISRLFLPNVNVASVPLVFTLADAFPAYCFPMLGLHPCEVKTDWETELNQIKAFANHRKIYAIGEIGIDLYWNKTTLPEQQNAFKQQIKWAKLLDLPIVIHCREAFNEVYTILTEETDKNLRGILHCFTGTYDEAIKIIDLGFFLGIGGVVTYKTAGLDKVLQQIDIKHIVLETDSPYLTPVPYRGKLNESSYLSFIAQKIADIYQTDIEVVAAVTTENSKLVFGI